MSWYLCNIDHYVCDADVVSALPLRKKSIIIVLSTKPATSSIKSPLSKYSTGDNLSVKQRGRRQN